MKQSIVEVVRSKLTGRRQMESRCMRRLRLEPLEPRHLLVAVIAPVDAGLSSVGGSYLDYGTNGDNWYNGSGLTDATIVETGDPVPATWPEHVAGNNLNRVSRIRDAAEVNTLTFDLGGTFYVSGMALWNSTEQGQTDRGFENTVLSYSTDGGATFTGSDTLTWTQRTADESANQGNAPTPPIATFAPEVQSLPSSVTGVTHIRMDVDNFSSEAIVMASEIRFLGEVDTGISLSLTADMVLDSQALIFPDSARFSRDPNGSPYRTEPLLTHDGYQFATWYNRGTGDGVGADIGISIARRDLSGDTWEVVDTGLDMVNAKRIWDSHNVISLGIASDGRLHLAYDMHANDLRYATTPAGRATGSDWHVFNTERDSLNSNSASLTRVTYPRFINNGDDMLMTFREGGSGNGDIELLRYDSSAALPHRWVDEDGNTSGDLTQTIISGAGTYINPIDGSTSTTRNAYLNGVDVDPNGRIHITWTWRENSQGSNHDINYAYSDDNGATWRNSAGANLGSTVSISSPGIIISSLDERQALINQQGQAVDNLGGVHALVYHRRQEPGFEWQQGDGLFFKGDSAYFHYYRDPLSGTWTDSMLPTDRVVGSRPSIGFDRDNNVYAAYLTRAGGNDILRIAVAEKLAAGGYAPWEVITEDLRDWLGTPLLDQERLLNDNTLSIFLQENTTSDSLTGTNLHVLEYSIDGLEDRGELTVTIADASVSEADGVGATTATVSRNTDTTDPLTVTLVSDDTTEATVLGTVTIAAGQTTSAPFNIDAIDDAIVDGTQTVTVTASAAAHADGTDTVDVTDNDTVQDSPFVIAPIAASLQSDGGSYLEYGTDGDNWYNGSGLSDATIVETGDPVPAVWPEHVAGNNQTRVSRIRSAAEVNTLTIPLGGKFDVSGMVLWNSTERAAGGTSQTERGFENTVLSYSTDGGVTFTGSDTLTWTERNADASVNQGDNPIAPVAMFAPEVQVLPSTVMGVTHIRMDVDNFSAAGADSIVMVSEFRFIGTQRTLLPNLKASSFDANSDHLHLGGTAVGFTVANTGSGAASAFQTQIVWSPNGVLGDSDDLPVAGTTEHFAGLAAGASEIRTISVQIDRAALYAHSAAMSPAGQPVGTVARDGSHLFLVVDSTGAVSESDETDNAGRSHLVDSDKVTSFPWDIDGNGTVTPVEALNAIRAVGTATADNDFDGNGIVTPLEALSVLQRIGYVRDESVIESSLKLAAASHAFTSLSSNADTGEWGVTAARHAIATLSPFPEPPENGKSSLFAANSNEAPVVIPSEADDFNASDHEAFTTTEWLDVI